jgi:hypothetical protein
LKQKTLHTSSSSRSLRWLARQINEVKTEASPKRKFLNDVEVEQVKADEKGSSEFFVPMFMNMTKAPQ